MVLKRITIKEFKKSTTYKLLKKKGRFKNDREIRQYLSGVHKFIGEDPLIIG